MTTLWSRPWCVAPNASIFATGSPPNKSLNLHNRQPSNLTQLLLIAYSAVLTAAADRGLGRHMEYVLQDPQRLIDVGLLSFVSQPLVVMSCAFGKTSFALSLLRVAIQRWAIVLLWFIIISMNVLHIVISFFVFLRCEDPRHLWNPAIPSKCWPASIFDNISYFIGCT